MDKREFNARGEAFCAILQKRLHGFDYVTIIKNGLFNSNPPHYQITVRFEPNALKDTNCIVGKLVYHGITYLVYRGERGGLYFWKKKSRGPHRGEYYKKYCSHLSISPVNGGGNYWRKNVIKGLIDRICAESWEYETQCEWDEKACAFIISLFDKAQTTPQSGNGGEAVGGGFEDDEDDEDGEGYEGGEDEEEGEGDDDGEGDEDEDRIADGWCPICGAEAFENEEGVICCSECDWNEDVYFIFCPKCNAIIKENDDGTMCCPECGWNEDKDYCPECGAFTDENEDGKLFCPECGWQEGDGENDDVCPECGSPLKEFDGIKYCPECDWDEEGGSFERCPSCKAPIVEIDDIKHCSECDWDERDDWGSDEWREYYENR